MKGTVDNGRESQKESIALLLAAVQGTEAGELVYLLQTGSESILTVCSMDIGVMGYGKFD